MKFNAWELVCLEEALNEKLNGCDLHSGYGLSAAKLLQRIQREKPRKLASVIPNKKKE